MTTAVIAQTKPMAKRLARDLGIDSRWVFGARCAASFVGLRADLVLIDAEATLPEAFMATVRWTVAKRGGKVRFVTCVPDIVENV